jgi:hypothetical protein
MVERNATLHVRARSRTITVSIESGMGTCLPDDFPLYPAARTTSVFNHPCRVDMGTTDSPAQVIAFYSLRLDEGDWHLASARDSAFIFSRRSNPTIGGTLEVDSAAIHIRFNREFPTPTPS